MQLELLEKSVPHQFRERVAQLLLGFAEHVHHIQTTSDGFRAPEAVWDKVAAHLNTESNTIVAALKKEAADLTDDQDPAAPVTDPSTPVTDPTEGEVTDPATPVSADPTPGADAPVADPAPAAATPAATSAKTTKTAAK